MKSLWSLIALGATFSVTQAVAEDKFVPVGSGAWTIMETHDAMSDAGRGIAALDSPDGSIIVKCDPGSHMYIEFASKSYLGASDNAFRPLIFRFDQGQVQNGRGFYDGRTAGLMEGNIVSSFVTQLLRSKTLAVRATTYDGNEVNASFSVQGGDEAISRAYKACGMPLP